MLRGNTLFHISRHSLKSHITTNKCFSGTLSSFKSRTLEKSLHNKLIKCHNSMREDPALAYRIVHNQNNFQIARKNLPYCNRCGFIGSKLCHVRRHVQLNSNLCSASDVRPADGTILTNEYGFFNPQICTAQYFQRSVQSSHKTNSKNHPTSCNIISPPISTHNIISSTYTFTKSRPYFTPSNLNILITYTLSSY